MSPTPLPLIDDDNRHFWQGGRDGSLLIMRCRSCGWWIHQPQPVCPRCLSFDVEPHPTSGHGTVAAYTINYQRWIPDLEVPYVLAMVELEEQAGLRLMTRLVQVRQSQVETGLRVQVCFERRDDVWLPLFRPASGPGAT